VHSPSSNVDGLEGRVGHRDTLGWRLRVHLRHDGADVEDALYDGVAAPGDGDGPLGGVGEHLAGHLDRRPGDLADLLDLGAALADEGAALRGRDDQPEGDGGARHGARGDEVIEVLFELVAYEGKCLEYGFCVSCDGDDTLGAAAIAYVDLSSTLFSKAFDYVALLAYNTAHFFALHDEANGKGDIGAVGGGVVRGGHLGVASGGGSREGMES